MACADTPPPTKFRTELPRSWGSTSERRRPGENDHPVGGSTRCCAATQEAWRVRKHAASRNRSNPRAMCGCLSHMCARIRPGPSEHFARPIYRHDHNLTAPFQIAACRSTVNGTYAWEDTSRQKSSSPLAAEGSKPSACKSDCEGGGKEGRGVAGSGGGLGGVVSWGGFGGVGSVGSAGLGWSAGLPEGFQDRKGSRVMPPPPPLPPPPSPSLI